MSDKDSILDDSPIIFKNYFYQDQLDNSVDLFKWCLNLEKQKGLRINGTVSLLYIEFIENPHEGNQAVDFQAILENTLKLILSHFRNSDIVFIVNNQIKLILTNSSKEGAQAASRRIYGTIRKFLLKEDLQKNASFVCDVILKAYIWDYQSKVKHKIVIYDNEVQGEICNPIPVNV